LPEAIVKPEAPQPDWLTRFLVGLYPRAWQHRYGEEMLETVAGRRLGPAAVVDLLRGALDAHLHLPNLLQGWSSMEQRTRRSAVIVLAAAAVFAAAVMGLAETRDQVSFAGSPAHLAGALIFGLAWVAMAVAGLSCLVASFAVAGLALAWMRQARDYRPLRFVLLAGTAALAALASGWALGHLVAGHVGQGSGAHLFFGWQLLLGLCAAACIYAAYGLLRAVELPARAWRLLRALTWVVAGAIVLGSVALLAYLASFAAMDARLLSARDGMLATPLLPTLLAIVAGSIVAAVVAAGAVRQGEGASGSPHPGVGPGTGR
jgi:MFS family permease